MAKRGRPSRYSAALAGEICQRLAAGESLRSICRDEKMPALSTVLLWVVDGQHPDFSEQYRVAREAAGFAHADQIIELTQDLLHEQIKPDVARVIIDGLKWSAERMAPKSHSPRQMLDHTSSDRSMSPERAMSDEELDERIKALSEKA